MMTTQLIHMEYIMDISKDSFKYLDFINLETT